MDPRAHGSFTDLTRESCGLIHGGRITGPLLPVTKRAYIGNDESQVIQGLRAIVVVRGAAKSAGTKLPNCT